MRSGRGGITAVAGLHVAIKTRLASTLPVGSCVVVSPWPGTQEAEEDVLRWLDHNAHMPTPNNQISRFGLLDSLEGLHAAIEFGRGRVAVGHARLLINGMNQVRAIRFGP